MKISDHIDPIDDIDSASRNILTARRLLRRLQHHSGLSPERVADAIRNLTQSLEDIERAYDEGPISTPVKQDASC